MTDSIDHLLPTLDECQDLKNYFMSLCESQQIKSQCIQDFNRRSLFCCGLLNTTDLDVGPLYDTTRRYRNKVYKYGIDPSPIFPPIFLANANGEPQLQQLVDGAGFTSCIFVYKFNVRVCFRSEELPGRSDDDGGIFIETDGPSGGGSESGGSTDPDPVGDEDELMSGFVVSNMTVTPVSPSIATITFNKYCNNTIVGTEQVDVPVGLQPGGAICTELVVELPIFYAAGQCDLNTVAFQVDDISISGGDQDHNTYATNLWFNSASVCASCENYDSCLVDLKSMIPSTGDCADPRLFFIGYQYNQQIMIDRLNEATDNLKRCCDLFGDGDDFFVCAANLPRETSNDLEDQNEFPVAFFDQDSGDSINNLANNLGADSCYFRLIGNYEICAMGDPAQSGDYLGHYTKTIELYCGLTLIDTAIINFYPTLTPNEINCFTQGFRLDYDWNPSCPFTDLSVKVLPTVINNDDESVIDEEYMIDLCGNVRCLT